MTEHKPEVGTSAPGQCAMYLSNSYMKVYAELTLVLVLKQVLSAQVQNVIRFLHFQSHS